MSLQYIDSKETIEITYGTTTYEIRGSKDVVNFFTNLEPPMPFDIYQNDKRLIKTYATIKLAKEIRKDKKAIEFLGMLLKASNPELFI